MSDLTIDATSTTSRGRLDSWRRTALAIGLAAVVAGCATSTGTPGASPISSVAGATATAISSPTATSTAVAAATDTSTPTDQPTSTPTATPKATPKPTPKPTPLPPLAIGLCKGSQLKLTLQYWVGSSGNPSYAHLSATNVSSGACTMRGTPRSQIIDGSGHVIADSGNGGSEIKTSDTPYAMAPNDVIYVIFTWSNWCKTAPKQKASAAVVMPFGLGRMVAKANGNAPIPNCSSSGHSTSVSAMQWAP